MERHAVIVAGFGFRAGATTASLQAALDAARLAEWPVTHLATLEDKAPALAELARLLAVPLVVVPPARIAGSATPTQSSASQAARGAGSVAEACALVAAGADARLLAARSISHDRMATCAIAAGAST